MEVRMPAVLTHDFFGQDVYDKARGFFGDGQDARDAFLLGNQGPDPLFYLVVLANKSARDFVKLGSRMHHDSPSKLLASMAAAVGLCPVNDRDIARAYAAGFMCHYTLDSNMHPLVYAQQYAICNAGVEGLTEADGSDVHAEIERDWDEMVLYTKTGKTIRTYKPYEEVLKASDHTLSIIDDMLSFAIKQTYDLDIPNNLFTQAVRRFRLTQKGFYSPDKVRHHAVGAIETKLWRRNQSFYAAMAHRESLDSDFDNRDHLPWTNPYVDEVRTDSFWDIFDNSQDLAVSNIERMLAPGFNVSQAQEITQGLDFSGKPTE
jgi:hypothetical protein